MATYNGWKNYATWRVNLEMFDGVAWIDDFDGDVSDLADYLKDLAQEYIQEQSHGLALDYALAFLSEVDWYEIARSMKDFEEENDQLLTERV